MKTIIVLLFLIICTGRGIQGDPCAPCRCERLRADCTNKTLTEIPPGIPTNIIGLGFRKNNLNLTSQTFKGFESLQSLKISWNNIRVLPRGTFKGLRNLERLYLDHNPFSYDDFYDSLFLPLQKLTALQIQGSHSAVYPNEALQAVRSLQSLYIDGVDNQEFGKGFHNLKKLTRLRIHGRKGYCNITRITRNTFLNLRYLQKVYINYCKRLSIIENGSFAHLQKLTILDISNNMCVGMDGLTQATEGISHTIEILLANKIEQFFPFSVVVHERFAQNLQNTSLRVLKMDGNKISACSFKTLRFAPKTLRQISLRDHRLEYSPYLIFFPTLSITELDISGMDTYFNHDLPQTFDDVFGGCPRNRYKRNTLSRNQNNLFTKMNVIQYLTKGSHGNISIGLPPHLTILKWSMVGLRLHLDQIRFLPNSIKSIDLSNNIISKWIGPVYGFHKLTHLNLSVNRVNVLGPHFFDDVPKLTDLDISHNFLGNVIAKDTEGLIFQKLTTLKILNLTENMITKLHKTTFSGLRSLEMLILAHNGINSVDMMYVNSLVHIDMSSNVIRWLKIKFINKIEKQANSKEISFDISNNPLSCTCESLETLKWIAESNIDFGNISSYSCMLLNDRKHTFTNKMDVINLYTHIEYSCRYFSTLLGVGAAVLLILCVIIGGMVHRYRWKLRYWYFAAKYRYNSSNENSQEFRYDAFISYTDEDRGFVVNDMVNKLETDEDFMLNIHQRDFTPGRSIAENIIEAIQTSRRTVCILSRSFLESYWCMYELQMANMERVTTGRDVLLIIMMEEIPLKDIPAEILYYIQTNSYLEYPADGDEDLFWRNLNITLKT